MFINSEQRTMNYAMSRRKRGAVYALILLLAGILIWLDHSPVRSKWQGRPESAEQVKFSDAAKYQGKRFTVARVVDGDTIWVDGVDVSIRFSDVNAPELDTPEGVSAKWALIDRLYGERVALFCDGYGYYGRWLCIVEVLS